MSPGDFITFGINARVEREGSILRVGGASSFTPTTPSPGSDVDNLLLENGDDLLLEFGDTSVLVLEGA